MSDTERPVVFLDLETTGLDAARHEIWEAAFIETRRDHNPVEWQRFFPVTLYGADAHGLTVGGFHERWSQPDESDWYNTAPGIREVLFQTFHDAIIVGNNVLFDLEFLTAFLGSKPWFYKAVDVMPLMAGKLGLRPPYDTEEMLAAAGLPVVKEHTALEDARKVRALYDFALSH